MVIDYLNFSGVPVQPHKTDAKHVVYANRVLPLAVAFERLMRGSDPGKIGQFFRRVEHDQLSECDPLNTSEPAALLFAEDLLRFRAAKGNDHQTILSRIA